MGRLGGGRGAILAPKKVRERSQRKPKSSTRARQACILRRSCADWCERRRGLAISLLSPENTFPAAMAPTATTSRKPQQQWSTSFDTLRRQKLFQNPPKDKTAYPTLAAAVEPHINSFNAIFTAGGQLEHGLKDIGTKVFLDGSPQAQPEEIGARNRLSVRIQDVFVDKAVLPPSNKVALKNRNIFPAECRERHATYRGKMRARLGYRINNGDWQEEVCDLGNVPLMLRVRIFLNQMHAMLTSLRHSQIGATSRTTARTSSSRTRKRARSLADTSSSTESRKSYECCR